MLVASEECIRQNQVQVQVRFTHRAKVKFGISAPTCTFYSPSTGCISGRKIRCQIPEFPAGAQMITWSKKTERIWYKCGNNDGKSSHIFCGSQSYATFTSPRWLQRCTPMYIWKTPCEGLDHSSTLHTSPHNPQIHQCSVSFENQRSGHQVWKNGTIQSGNIHHHTQRHTGGAATLKPEQPCCYLVR